MPPLEITVTMHPSMWATVLRQLRIAGTVTEAHIKRDLTGKRLSVSEAIVWSADIDMATEPIKEAVKEAVKENPAWERWFQS